MTKKDRFIAQLMESEKAFAGTHLAHAERIARLEPPFRAKNIAICIASAYRQGIQDALAAKGAQKAVRSK